MSLSALLLGKVAKPVSAFLLRQFVRQTVPALLGGVDAALADSLFDTLLGKFTETAHQRDAKRRFEYLGDQIVERLCPTFEESQKTHPDLNTEAVAHELGGRIAHFTLFASSETFLENDLDPGEIAAGFGKEQYDRRPLETDPARSRLRNFRFIGRRDERGGGTARFIPPPKGRDRPA